MAKTDYKTLWHTLKDELMQEYPESHEVWKQTHGEGEAAESYMLEQIILKMDKLDGTQEFNNVLNDMGMK